MPLLFPLPPIRVGQTRLEWEPKVPGPFHMLKRMGEMSEVAAAVAFLCSNDAAYINGETQRDVRIQQSNSDNQEVIQFFPQLS